MPKLRDNWPDRAYELLSGDDDLRVCEPLDDAACREVPRGFLLNSGNGTCTKLAEQLASPGLVLAWLMGAIGAPVYLIGLLAPVRETGSLLPQLAIAGRIRGAAVRKWFWVGAGLVQGISLLGMVLAIGLGEGAAAGWMIIGCLAVFSIASGVGSVAFKDVTAKTIPKGRRGRLLAVRATTGGLLALLAGLGLRALREDPGVEVFVFLLLCAAGLWIIAAGLFALIKEQPGQTDGGRSALDEASAGFKLVSQNAGLRWFIVARGLLAMGVALAAPFYAGYVQDRTSGGAGGLGTLLIAVSLAAVISSPFWGRFSDASSRRVMISGGMLGAASAVLLLLVGTWPLTSAKPWAYGLVFILLGLAQAGNRLGRKSYLLDGAPADDRPTYVAISNTLIGVFTLAGAGLGWIGQWLGLAWLIAILGALSLAGSLTAWIMPEAEDLPAPGSTPESTPGTP
ncbi:MAG: MFS transporter [Phycisphaeraceae bacterium]|nr:MFS transporter [Phycisphaeraceae bacterium]